MPVSEAIAFVEAVYGPGATTYSSDGALNVTSVRELGRRTYSALKVYFYIRCEWGYGGSSDGWFSENSLTPSFNGVQRQYKIKSVYYGIK